MKQLLKAIGDDSDSCDDQIKSSILVYEWSSRLRIPSSSHQEKLWGVFVDLVCEYSWLKRCSHIDTSGHLDSDINDEREAIERSG